MFCPSCGKESLDERKFCSNCGTNLHLVNQAITGLLQQPNIQIPEDQLPDSKRKKFKSLGFISIAFGVIYLMTMMIVSEIVHQFNDEVSRILENLAMFSFLFFVTGILTMIYGRMMYKQDKNSQRMFFVTPQSASQPKKPITSELPQASKVLPPSEAEPYQPYNYQPPSITEHTTAQLKQPIPIRLKNEQ